MTFPILKILNILILMLSGQTLLTGTANRIISNKLGIKQLMAGGGIIILAQTVIPLLSGLFGGGGEGGGEG